MKKTYLLFFTAIAIIFLALFGIKLKDEYIRNTYQKIQEDMANVVTIEKINHLYPDLLIKEQSSGYRNVGTGKNELDLLSHYTLDLTTNQDVNENNWLGNCVFEVTNTDNIIQDRIHGFWNERNETDLTYTNDNIDIYMLEYNQAYSTVIGKMNIKEYNIYFCSHLESYDDDSFDIVVKDVLDFYDIIKK